MKKFMSALLTLLVVASLMATALAATVRTTGNVWLRKGPGLSYSKITSVGSGTKLEYQGKTSTDDRGVKWYYVKYKGKKCWVSSRYSKLSGSSSSSSSSSS
ncbi:MAG: SH3 domain-containing protein, partial [Clostridia bacterium]|nr:SH3 domain-containing protein [Clostridia bacterium]